ncbi:MAG: 5-formyltetrahydrofolate cyclo-ligase [Desulfobulbus sp.]|nr:5-formyltetrahydrofolate cyclo-ligase [Desulfobulbus sp.]
MSESSTSQPTELRRRILTLRNQLTLEERATLDNQLLKRLLEHPALSKKQYFFVYYSYQSEVATGALVEVLLSRGKTVCVPLTDPSTFTMQAVFISNPQKELVPGYKGIPEPIASLIPANVVSPTHLEVALIPGAVFDHRGYRLGYGGGYYDRFLALKAPQALRIGLAYSVQVVDKIANQSHDVPMDMLATEKDIFSWPRNRFPEVNQL